MPELTRPDAAEPVDASALDRAALSTLRVGTRVTGINGTTSVWKVVRPGILRRISEGEPSDV